MVGRCVPCTGRRIEILNRTRGSALFLKPCTALLSGGHPPLRVLDACNQFFKSTSRLRHFLVSKAVESESLKRRIY